MSDRTISVIICTRDRPASFRRALTSVLAQDLPPDEVVVVDGSEPPVEVPERAGLPLRVIRGQRQGEGRARAAGLRAAEGDLIAWCDDDDEWPPDQLRVLREALLARPEALLAARGFDRVSNARVTTRGSLPIPAGDVLHVRAAALRAGGFDHRLHARAAGDLWSRMRGCGPFVTVSGAGATHHPLPAIATPEEQSAARARLRRATRDVETRFRETRARLSDRERGLVPFDPDTWCEGRRELLFQAAIEGAFSLAFLSRMMSRALLDLGVRVTLGHARERVPGPDWDALYGPLEPEGRLLLICEPRLEFTIPPCERVVRYFMWETTVIPPWQVEEFNAMLVLLYVPCRELARSARANGVEVPVRVLHHGVDPRDFPYLERPRADSDPFVFGSHGALQPRKGTDLLIRAFQEEFRPREPVRLVLKHTWGMDSGYAADDERITITGGYVGASSLLEFLRGLDAYVLPSRGEGFGLTGLEAMATGLPLIATNWSGPTEYVDPADSFPLNYHMGDAGGIRLQNYRDFGEWAEPDIDHLRYLMRHLYEHREEGIEAGRRASARVRRDYTWQRVAQQIIDDFDLLARGISPAESDP